MSTKLPRPPMPVMTATDAPKPMKEEYHHHGDPVLDATMKHDRTQEEAEALHRQSLKEVYDEHARLMEHERHGAFLGDHTLWYAQDYLPEPKKGEQVRGNQHGI